MFWSHPKLLHSSHRRVSPILTHFIHIFYTIFFFVILKELLNWGYKHSFIFFFLPPLFITKKACLSDYAYSNGFFFHLLSFQIHYLLSLLRFLSCFVSSLLFSSSLCASNLVHVSPLLFFFHPFISSPFLFGQWPQKGPMTKAFTQGKYLFLLLLLFLLHRFTALRHWGLNPSIQAQIPGLRLKS